MEFLKRTWTQIRLQTSQLAPTQMWLILSLMVILLLVGYVMLQYAAAPEMVPITGFAGDREKAVTWLEQRGIHVESEGGQIMVGQNDYLSALGALEQANLLAEDTTAAFDDLIRNHSPWLSTRQQKLNMLIAKQKVLGAIVSTFKGVRSAQVMASMPEKEGFGTTHVMPSASVNVEMQGRGQVSKSLVKAVAGLVSGAFARLRPSEVVVIDANAGRQHTMKDPMEVPPGETLENLQKVEAYHKAKIENFLRNIPNVIIAVNVQTDSVLRKQTEGWTYQPEDQLQRELNEERIKKQKSDRGEPGVRPNIGASINDGSAAGSEETESRTESEFRARAVTEKTTQVELGHATRKINVSVNVPYGYVNGLFKIDKGAEVDDAGPPDDAFVAAELDNIKSSVEPLIEKGGNVGTVSVVMIPDSSMFAVLDAPKTTGLMDTLSSRTAKYIGLGALALVSIGVMLGMVRKATAPQDLPTVEELAGLPPGLEGEEEIIGRAAAADGAIQGIEVDAGEARSRRVAEQITEMINASPTEAGSLINRWLRTDD
jgi:flagellar biosynthesis/type III secretory pathway M-ring protein FliF/YscJ